MTHIIRVYYLPGCPPRFRCSVCGDIPVSGRHILDHRVHIRIECHMYIARCHESHCGGKPCESYDEAIQWATAHTNSHNYALRAA